MPLTANFLADFSSFLEASANATKATEELVEAAGKVGPAVDQAVGQSAESLKTVGSGIAEFGKNAWSILNSSQLKSFASDVTSFVSGFISDFAQAEAATARLAVAVRNAGLPPEVVESYGAMATQLQKVSTFSDEAITDVQALFTSIGKIGPEAMQPTVQATMDLATALGIDLHSAALLVARAAASDGESLGKLKMVLGDSVQPGADFAAVMQAINEKFGGQALAALDTTAGSMENLKNQMSDINEIIGKALADNLRIVFDWFQKLPEGVQTFIVAATAIGTALAPILVSLASLASLLGSTGLGAALVTAGEAVATFVAGLLGWPAIIIAAIVALAGAIYYYWDEIVAFLGKAVAKIKEFVTVTLPNAFTSAVQAVSSFYYSVKYWLQDQLSKVIDFVVSAAQKIGAAFQWLYSVVVGWSYVPDMIDGIKDEFSRLDRVMVDPALAAVDEVNTAFADAMGPTLTPSAAGFAGALGGGAGGVTVNVNMSGMLGTDDPQTRALVSDLVSNAVMQGMRGGRLLGTA